MGFLSDTCIFIKHLDQASKIIGIAEYCNEIVNKKICITDIILDELNPSSKLSNEDIKTSKQIVNTLNRCDNLIEKFDVNKTGKYNKNFQQIRERYYHHLKDPEYIKQKVKQGEIKIEDVRSKKIYYRDYGECSCIAVAMEEPDKYIIVSNDKGRVCLKPEINLFKKFSESHSIKVLEYDEWIKNIKYNPKKASSF